MVTGAGLKPAYTTVEVGLLLSYPAIVLKKRHPISILNFLSRDSITYNNESKFKIKKKKKKKLNTHLLLKKNNFLLLLLLLFILFPYKKVIKYTKPSYSLYNIYK